MLLYVFVRIKCDSGGFIMILYGFIMIYKHFLWILIVGAPANRAEVVVEGHGRSQCGYTNVNYNFNCQCGAAMKYLWTIVSLFL